MWMQILLKDHNVPSPKVPRLWCDNIEAKYLSSNPMLHVRTRLIVADYHFVRERVVRKMLEIDFVPSNDRD